MEKRDGGAGLVEALDHDPSQALGQHRLHSPLEVGRNVEEISDRSHHAVDADTAFASNRLEDRADPAVISLADTFELA